jgi:amidase
MASQKLDVLVYPNSQVLPPTRKKLDDWKWPVLTFTTNALIAAQADLPSVSLPAGLAKGNFWWVSSWSGGSPTGKPTY